MKVIIAILTIFIVWGFINSPDEVSLGSGILVDEEPIQIPIQPASNVTFDEFTISKIAEFKLKAKVLAKKNYRFGKEAKLSPTDLVLGWNKMSDQSIVDQIKISQSGRWYYWKVDSFPIPRKEIQTNSANMHLIPSNDLVRHELKRIRKGDIVQITGSLVNVSDKGSWYWNSSTTREDTGNGACEIILVDSLYIITDQT